MRLYGTLVLAVMSVFIGYLAQRSRMCFVAGVRDYILVRDRELLYGMFTFIVTIWVLTSVLYGGNWLRSGVPEYGASSIRDSIERVGSFSLRWQNLGKTLEAVGGIRGVLYSRFFYVTMTGGFILGAVSTVAMYLWEYKAIADNYTEVLPAWLVNGYGYLYIGTGVVIAVISLVVVSLITPRSSDEHLAAVDETPVDGAEAIEAVSEHMD